MLEIIHALRRNLEHWRLAVRTAEALVAIHGLVGAERAYAEAALAAGDPSVGPDERGQLNLIAPLARKRFREIERIAPEERSFVYVRWLCRKGQIITQLVRESRQKSDPSIALKIAPTSEPERPGAR